MVYLINAIGTTCYLYREKVSYVPSSHHNQNNFRLLKKPYVCKQKLSAKLEVSKEKIVNLTTLNTKTSLFKKTQ